MEGTQSPEQTWAMHKGFPIYGHLSKQFREFQRPEQEPDVSSIQQELGCPSRDLAKSVLQDFICPLSCK